MIRTLQIHIPRTAGVSMRRWARRHVPSYQRIPSRHDRFDRSVMYNYLGHLSPGNLIGNGEDAREWFDGCFKFAFVRNSWGRILSLYHLYRPRLNRESCDVSNEHLQSFCVFVREITSGSRWVRPINRRITRPYFSQVNSQLDWLRWGVDFIGRFENLDEDWRRLCKAIGTDYAPLKRHNAEFHVDDYREHYTDGLRDLVAGFYADEIKEFGFDFDKGMK